MADAKQLELLAKGPERWNDWRRGHPQERPDLRNAYLAEADLSELDLQGADFSRAVLLGAKFDAADLRNAVFADSDLSFADLRGARLRGARFDGARGVPRRIVRAAARAPSPWRRRPSASAPLAVAAAALLLSVGYVASSALSGAALTGSAAMPDPAVGLDAQERLVLSLRARLGSLSLAAVDIDAGVLTMRVDRVGVGEGVFLPAIGAACAALLDTQDMRLQQIRVADRSGVTGWVYRNPDNCRTLIEAPLEMIRVVAAVDSRPF